MSVLNSDLALPQNRRDCLNGTKYSVSEEVEVIHQIAFTLEICEGQDSNIMKQNSRDESLSQNHLKSGSEVIVCSANQFDLIIF
jgi:hypothetical protein